MAITGMATVRQSITALYEESEKSAGDGLPMLAIIDSEPPAPSSEDEMAEMKKTPAIAARFDELRRLADLEMPPSPDRPSPDRPAPSASPGKTAPKAGREEAGREDAGREDAGREDTGREAVPDATPAATSQPLRFDPSADEILLPSEPPAPAARNGASDLEVDDIRRLVQEAWDDETAIGRPDIEPPADTASAIQADDPDIESAMEDIAAAVGQSGDAAVVNLEELKAELVTAMRAELQAVVETDLKAMVKAVVAEALKDVPAKKTATRAKKAAPTKVAKKKTAPDTP